MNETTKKSKDLTVAKAKGRPMLTWVGKKPLSRVRAYPAQALERFDATAGKSVPLQEANWSDWPKDLPKGGLLYHGDNKDVLAHLLANGFRGKVKLIYIDPPFDSGADYVRKVSLRGANGTIKIDGEEYTLGEQVQYSDIWANDNYLQFMYERLLLLRELLREDGWIALHCDSARNSELRMLLNEVFGPTSFRNEVVWHYSGWNRFLEGALNRRHDTIYFYAKSDESKLERFAVPWESREAYVAARKQKVHLSEDGREYVLSDAGGGQRVERFLDEAIADGRPIDDVWRVDKLNNSATEGRNYETQKPEELVARVVKSCSIAGDIVLDCFIGSGTTALVAQRSGRRWICCDINRGAIQTTGKAVQELMRSQANESAIPQQRALIAGVDTITLPAQLTFATYRVNDYDLQIQHNEAIELACQHLGVTRTRTDSFFEGTQGGRLVKIVPFNHPLTPMDLEVVRNELKTRPTEERDVMVVCLGWQHDARAWVDAYNRNRPINKLHVVELRTDSKLGGIIKHEPLTAQVSAKRTGAAANAQLVVTVQDVVSPSIIQRLNMEQGVFRAQITDWRAVVDCLLIDTQYDGQVFNVVLADVPERKQDLVNGRYELPASHVGPTVAVKIIDMLGEELIVTLAS